MVVFLHEGLSSVAARFLEIALHELVDGNVEAGAEQPGNTDHEEGSEDDDADDRCEDVHCSGQPWMRKGFQRRATHSYLVAPLPPAPFASRRPPTSPVPGRPIVRP